MTTSNDWVLLRAFSNSLEANVVCSFLNSQGIETTVRDAHIININWLYSNAVGGVKVLVMADQREQAIDALEEQEGKTQLEVVGIPCPMCSSVKTEQSINIRRGVVGLVMTLFSVVLPLSQVEKWRCEDCGHNWEEKDSVGGVFNFVNWFIFLCILGFLVTILLIEII